MTYPPGAETLRDLKLSLAEGLIPEGFSGLMRGFVEGRGEAADERGTLHLNATCSLIRRLAAPARKQAALALIAHFARLFCGRMLDASQATADLGAWRRSLERLVSP